MHFVRHILNFVGDSMTQFQYLKIWQRNVPHPRILECNGKLGNRPSGIVLCLRSCEVNLTSIATFHFALNFGMRLYFPDSQYLIINNYFEQRKVTFYYLEKYIHKLWSASDDILLKCAQMRLINIWILMLIDSHPKRLVSKNGVEWYEGNSIG